MKHPPLKKTCHLAPSGIFSDSSFILTMYRTQKEKKKSKQAAVVAATAIAN
jgi:hypothetical protein